MGTIYHQILIKSALQLIILFVILSNTLFAQCTGDVMPMDFSSGKVMTHRMYFSFSKEDKKIAQEWNENADIWITQKDFIQTDLRVINKNSNPPWFHMLHSADSNIYYLLHGDSQQRKLAFRELSSQNPDTLVSLISQIFHIEPSSRLKTSYGMFICSQKFGK